MNHSASTPSCATTLTIPTHYLKALAEFAAGNDIREYLNTINFRVTAGCAYLSASDGHIGAMLTLEPSAVDGPDFECCVPIGFFTDLGKQDTLSLRFTSKPSQEDAPNEHRMEVSLIYPGSTLSVQSLDLERRFPNLAMLFPAKPAQNPQTARLAIPLLTRIQKAYNVFTKSKNGHPKFGFGETSESVVLIDFGQPDVFMGLIMPLRPDPEPITLPAWISQARTSYSYEAPKAQPKPEKAPKPALQKERRKSKVPAPVAVPVQVQVQPQAQVQVVANSVIAPVATPVATPTTTSAPSKRFRIPVQMLYGEAAEAAVVS